MKDTHPLRIALYISIIITLSFDLVYFIYNIVDHRFDWNEILIYDVIIFTLTFFLSLYSIEHFVHRKIKLIYKTIHNLKTKKEKTALSIFDMNDHMEEVNQEVEEWAQTQVREVEALRKQESYRREFLGNVSHELKTPIFNIQGYISTLIDGGLEDPSINKDYLIRTEKSVNRMIAIIQDLEAISKLESGELQIEYSRFDIVELTREVIDFLHVKAEKEKVQLYIHKEYDEPVLVSADKENIRRVMINLIDNTINYCDRSKENCKTKISFFDMDEHLLIEAADNGIGVAEESIPRLFERFYRTDKARSRSQGGTGLGLSIVKHIIEAHHQTINVRSTPGVGTTMAFTLKKG